MWKNYLSDKSGSPIVVNKEPGEDNGLVVATRPHKIFTNKTPFFFNTTYGIDMNVNPGSSGTTVGVHNGIDDAYWTASDIVGGVKSDFNNSTQANNGSNSIQINNAPLNNEWQFDRGSDLDMNSYKSLTMYIYVDKDWAENDSISLYGWDTGTSLQVGNKVLLQDYFNWGVFDTWHKINIPLSHMGALSSYTTLDAFRMKIEVRDGLSPIFYIDDFWVNETGDPVVYIVEPDIGSWYHVESIKMTIADGHTGIVTVAGNTENASLPGLPYNKLLSLAALDSGITFTVEDGNVPQFGGTVKQLIDIIQFPGSEVVGYGGDGTNSWLSLIFKMTEPFLLKSEKSHKMSLTVSDDLTDLLFMRWSAGCKKELR